MTARAITEMSSAAWRPTIDPPSTTPVAGSEMIFTNPRGSLLISALADAENGTFVDADLAAHGERLGLGQPDVGDLGLGEDGRRGLVVVEVAVLARVQAHHVLGDLAALHRGHRRQRQLPRDVAGGVDVRHVRLAVVVDRDVAAVGRSRRPPRRARALGVGHRPDGEQRVADPRRRGRRRSARRHRVADAVDGRWPGRPSAATRRAGGSPPPARPRPRGPCWAAPAGGSRCSVTFEPSDENMCTNSTPVTPEPITTRCSGSSGGG